MTRLFFKGLFIIAIFTVIAGWGSADVFAVTYDVSIGSKGAFSPKTLTINTGDTVRWTATADGHQVASDQHPSHTEYPDPACPNAGCWDSPLLFTNDTYSFTFQLPGAWDYHNHQSPGKSGTITVTDLNTPAVVTDLVTSIFTSSTIDLTWTSPGDDVGSTANFGTPASYEIRYSTSTITEGNWTSATVVSDIPTVQAVDSVESVTVTGLTPETTYYFALKTSDEIPNESALSNVPTATTNAVSSDVIAPAAVTDLTLSSVTQTSIKLDWTAPGDDGNIGTANRYTVRYSTSPITEGNWPSATPVSGEPTPQIAGSAETMTISGLTSGVTYYFALTTSDEEPNISDLSSSAESSPSPPSSSGGGISDHIPPNPVQDLSVRVVNSTEVELTWTAPGDDESEGTAATYDIRYSKDILTPSTFSFATQIKSEPTPQAAGTAESFLISGLETFNFYHFALKSSDEEPNESTISNIATVIMTPPDFIAPSAIVDLTFINPSPTAVTLFWTAPGDDRNEGTAVAYDIRYLASEEFSETNWGFALQFIDEPTPGEAGSSESMTIPGFDNSTTYYIAIKTIDEGGNESQLSDVITFTTPPIPEEATPPESEPIPLLPLSIFSDGILIRATGDIKIYLIREGKQLWIPAAEVFVAADYDWDDIQEVEEDVVASTRTLTLFRIGDNSEVYVLHGDTRRHIPTTEAFVNEGYTWDNISILSEEEGSWYAEAILLRAPDDEKVFLIEDGTKRWIETEEEFLNLGYEWSDILEVSNSELEHYLDASLEDVII